MVIRMTLSTLSSSDWAVLIPIFFFQLGVFVNGIINTMQNRKQGIAIETVHTVVNSQADKLAEANRETVQALTDTIQAQQKGN